MTPATGLWLDIYMTNTATANTPADRMAADFANWVCDTIENKIAEGRTLGLTEDEIVAGTQSAMLAFLAGQ